ncbi:sigma-70 family RNA polymerase sigma factor [Microbacterium lacus]|uniref:RNA polymerase sigma factor n=1 Tax=Microbacterium lacus TaxID=415217 RepID=UPI00384FAE48
MAAPRRESRVDEETVERSDEDLVTAMRDGEMSGYAILWARHSAPARRAARAITSAFEPDDLVSEAFMSILGAIQRGAGPTGPFRPYLFATVRNIAATWARKGKDVALDELTEVALVDSDSDPLELLSTRTSIAKAFRRLPARHRTLLWYLEVEGMKPREIAPLMGLTPNAVSALSYRARDGFRQAWLDLHIADPSRPEDCRWVCERVLIQGDKPLNRADLGRFNEHLDGCQACQIVAADIEIVSQRLRVVLLPLLLGGTAATAYLSDTAPAAAAALGAWATTEAAVDSGIPVLTSSVGEGINIFSSAGIVAVEPTKHIGAGIGIGAALTTAAAATAIAVLAASGSWSPPGTITAETPVVVSTEPYAPASAPSPEPTGLPPTATPHEGTELPMLEVTPAPEASVIPAPPISMPLPPLTESAPLTDTTFRLTTVMDFSAPVPPLLEGTGTPGASVSILDENDVVLLTTAVSPEGSFIADVSGDLLHQGMTVRARQTVSNTIEPQFTEPVGPFVFPVPSIAGSGPAGILTAVDADGDGETDDVSILIDAIAGTQVVVSWDSGTNIHFLHLPAQPDDDTPIPNEPEHFQVTDIPLGSHTVVLRYADAITGRLGLATPEQSVTVATPGWGDLASGMAP